MSELSPEAQATLDVYRQIVTRGPRPVVKNCPGITWRPCGRVEWEARWRPRSDLVERGYPAMPARLWRGIELSDADHAQISERCNSMQEDMLLWGRGGQSPRDVGSFVYFITDGEAIKIGFSVAPDIRMGHLQSAHYRELRIMHYMPATIDGESALHEKFKHLQIRGEWFRADQELLDFIEEKRSASRQGEPL